MSILRVGDLDVVTDDGDCSRMVSLVVLVLVVESPSLSLSLVVVFGGFWVECVLCLSCFRGLQRVIHV